MTNAVAIIAIGLASWFQPHRTLRDGNYVCASRTLPKGTVVRVTEIHNRLSVLVEVDDFGPARWVARRKNVVIDLCPEAFSKLAGLELGLAEVTVERIK